jgi:hypothetical protein
LQAVSGIYVSGFAIERGISVRLAKELKDYDADADLSKITYSNGSW